MRRWAAGVLLLALAGLATSWVAASGVARNDAQRSREAFRMAAAQVAGHMQLEVAHETDLLISAAAFMQDHPIQLADHFQDWAYDVQATKRYPELIALAEMRAPRDLRACPAITFAGPAWIERYSGLARAAICRGTSSRELERGHGQVVNFGLDMLGIRFIGEDISVYRGGRAPETTAGRRRMFIGAVAIALYPQVLMQRALRGSPGIRLQLRTKVDAALTFSAGPKLVARPGGDIRSATEPLNNGLTATITSTVQGSRIFDDGTATLVLLGGGMLSGLLALALFLLGTGRARAMRLVDEKTGELAFQALHDPLTGLPNRMLVMDRIEHALARSARGELPVALLFIDFDGFKTVNDTLGHGAGDELLRTIGSRLAGLVRDADTVGRLGGDEFVVLLEPDDNRPAPEAVAERIVELLSQPIMVGPERAVHITASIGIAVGHRDTAEELLRDADLALYAAKHNGKNRYVLFEDDMQSAIADHHAIEVDLRRALANDELFLVYQPTFRLQDRRIDGVEALLRWQHPSRGLIPPDVFIPIAEESGLILEIGRWVAMTACVQAAAWRSRGLELSMAVNVSGKQLDEEHFADEIRQVLDATGLPACALMLEITETSLMRQPAAAAERLHELKRLGVRIAIDDFGTGYSSLAYLREFPVDALKIDRTFISGLGDSKDATTFVATLVQLGRTLKIETLGEGIEDEAQLARLIEANCGLGQGYLLARPLPAEQIEALLVDDRSKGGRSSQGGDADATPDEDAVPSI